MAKLKLNKINKVYPNGAQAVFDFNLEVGDKEFIALVGPSGCGKSTTLRMIAGLEDISSGTFSIDGRVVNEVAPKDRDIAMVFQSYALYPHMTVAENMGFSLKLRKMDKAEIAKKVEKAAKLLDLTEYLDRKPKALSGGQRQRVALGRAIVRNPKVFLMDEPLSNLDAKLRVQTRAEITKLHQDIGSTTIYVTHDQIEAMTMATRIVVMSAGRVQQVGSPREIYNNPANIFVAGFIGTPPMNFIKGKYEDGKIHVNGGVTLGVPEGRRGALEEAGYAGKEIVLGIRPEDLHTEGIVKETYSDAILNIKVDVSEFLGSESYVHATVGKDKMIAKIDGRIEVNIGDEIELAFDMNKAHFFDIRTEQVIAKK